jgi:hypothetical protein
VYSNDWQPKLAVGVIEDVIVENEAIIAAEEAQPVGNPIVGVLTLVNNILGSLGGIL